MINMYPQLLMQLEAQQAVVKERIANAERMGPVIAEARRLQHQRHVAALHRVLAQVEAAVGKIHDNSYGRCDSCDQQIPEPELVHDPSSSLCHACRGHLPRGD